MGIEFDKTTQNLNNQCFKIGNFKFDYTNISGKHI